MEIHVRRNSYMVSSRSAWAQSSLAARFVAGGVVIVGFALFLFTEYIYGNKSGLLVSILLALAPALMFAVSILFLSVGFTKMRQEHETWYKKQNILLGIADAFLAFTALTTGASINKILSPLLALFLGLTAAVLASLCIIQSIRVNQVKLRK